MLRVVLDTNVLVSGLLSPESAPGRIVSSWRAGGFRLVLSEFLLDELARVLSRSKLQRVLGWPPEKTARLVLELRVLADVVEPASTGFAIPRDPRDAPVLGTLVGADADLLVTGDADLLELRDRYPILTPAEFAQQL